MEIKGRYILAIILTGLIILNLSSYIKWSLARTKYTYIQAGSTVLRIETQTNKTEHYSIQYGWVEVKQPTEAEQKLKELFTIN